MDKTYLTQRFNNLRLRSITIFSIALIVVLLLLGIIVSFTWPINWNLMLNALILNIISSLIGVLAGALIAIFIVEKYLEQHRREIAEKEAYQERLYKEQWQAYLYGGLSYLSATITHLSLFVAYGKEKYLELLNAEGDVSGVPDSIEAFVRYYVNSINIRHHQKLGDDVDKGDKPRGMDNKDADRLEKAFSEIRPAEIHCSLTDINFLLNYLHFLHERLQDQIFLFQPFMNKCMGLGIVLIQLDRALMSITDDMQRILIKLESKDTTSIIQLNERSAIKYCEAGKLAIKVIQLIWNYAQGTGDDIKVVVNADVK